MDDCGRAVNPLILHGQTHGGIAQGVGQALWELCDYDPESGQLRSADLHGLRAAARRHAAVVHDRDQRGRRRPRNPLGLRGGGEGGTTPALGAVVNAVVDALADLGVEHLEMPVTPERVWRAIRAAAR